MGDTCFIYPQGGIYEVQLITQRDNLYDTTSATVYFAQNPVVDLGPDVTLCDDGIITYDLSYNDSNALDGLCEYEWTADLGTQTFYDSLPTYLIDKPGTYTVTVTGDSICNPAIDQIVVEYNNMVASLGVDVTTGLCQGDQHVLDATYSNTTYGSTEYIWNTGSISPSITVTSTGIYSVTMTNGSVAAGYCTDVDSVYVQFDAPLTPPLGPDKNLCDGQLMTLNAANAGANYAWSTGMFTQTIDVDMPGTYSVTITNDCGSITDEILLSPLDIPDVNLGNDITICEGIPEVIDAYFDNSTYVWSTNEVTPQIAVYSGGFYSVTVTNECGDNWDEIFVIADTALTGFSLGNDTAVCTGFVLDCGYPNLEYYWSNNSTADTIVITQSDDYGVDITNQCGTYFDVVHIDVIEMNLDLGGDQVFCPGSSLTLDAGNPGSLYQWSTGSQVQTTEVTQPGEVWVQVTNICETQTDTINVTEYDMTLDLGPDATICEGDNFMLDAGHPGATYSWSNGASSQTLDILQTGVYALTVSHFCGDLMDEIAVDVNPTPVVNFGIDTIYLTTGGGSTIIPVTLDPQATGTSYEWSNGASDSVIVVDMPSTYSVTITNEYGCVGEGSVIVTYKVGIDEASVENQVVLYPNPAKEKLFINLNNVRAEELQVYSSIGSLITKQTNLEGRVELNTNYLSEGIYFVKILTKENALVIKSFSIIK